MQMINVKYLELPCRVKALSTKNEDDSYTIILNSKLNIEQNKRSFLHELRHIKKNDFNKEDVNKIELDLFKEWLNELH